MRLQRVQVLRAPGLRHELLFDELAAGLNLVLGPNASGKSTFCRAVRACLWPEETDSRGLEIRTKWCTQAELSLEARLDAGRVTWVGARPKLPGGELARAYELSMRELLGDGAAAEVSTSIAERIARELTGGFDLPALIKRYSARLKPDVAKRQAFERARNEIAQIEAQQDQLAEREERLRALDLELAQTRELERALGPLVLARNLDEARSRLAAARAELTALPSALEHLDGSELGIFDEEQRRLAATGGQLRTCREQIERTRAALRADGLPKGALSGDELDLWRDRALILERREMEAERARLDLSGLQSREIEAARAVRATPVREGVLLEPGTLERMERTIERTQTLESQRATIEHQLAALREEPSGHTGPNDATLYEAVAHLRRWLASPELTEAPRSSGPSRFAWAFAGAGLTGIALGLATGPAALVAVGAAFTGVAVGLLWARPPKTPRPSADRASGRAAAQAAYGRTGSSPPSTWDPANVEARLRELETEREEASARRRELTRRQAERDRLEAERTKLTEQLDSLFREQRAWAEQIGLEPSLLGLELLVIARNVQRFVDSSLALAEGRARLEELERAVASGRAELSAFLQAHGGESASDAASLKVALGLLRRRSGERVEAERRLERLEMERVGHEQTIREAEARIAELLSKTAVPEASRVHLEALIRDLDVFRKLKSELALRASEITRLESELSPHPEIAKLERTALHDRHAEILAKVETKERWLEERAQIVAQLEQAGRGRSFEEALARRAKAEQDLAEDLELVLEGLTARIWIEHIEGLHRSRHEPEVLARARNWFGRFTHHAFELELAREDGPRLVARDTLADEQRSLEQLSDGTRAQLLLAARMAHLGGAEIEEKLPFFLDEALSTTDHARFEAVAESLLEIASEGRQIFYLSSNPADIEAWLQVAAAHGVSPRLIELGEPARAGRPEKERLLPAARPNIPSPGSSSPTEYARRLEVAEIDPEAPVSSWHLYYVAHHDLDLLHAALQHGVWTVGQWRYFENSVRRDPAQFTPAAIQRIDAHIAVAESTHRLTRIGRGRRVPVEALEASGAVSETFIEAARRELEKEDGEALRVVAAIGSLPRFQKSKRDQLREYLVALGYLDERPRYTEEEIVERVAEEVRGLIEDGIIATVDLAPLVKWYAEKSGWTPTVPVSYSA